MVLPTVSVFLLGPVEPRGGWGTPRTLVRVGSRTRDCRPQRSTTSTPSTLPPSRLSTRSFRLSRYLTPGLSTWDRVSSSTGRVRPVPLSETVLCGTKPWSVPHPGLSVPFGPLGSINTESLGPPREVGTFC